MNNMNIITYSIELEQKIQSEKNLLFESDEHEYKL